MKILVLGAGGMAGHLLATYFQEKGHNVDTLASKHPLNKSTVLIDLLNKGDFEKFLSNNEYDVIVNCVGILVEQSEKRKDLSTYLNSFLPHFLEQRYKDLKTKIIHLSTDCVFSGKNAPYREDDPHDGELYYDKTKALGEINNNKDLTFRMSIIGPEIQENGIGLFHWFMRQRGLIYGYTDSIWNGITTLELAKGIEAAIEQGLTGIYHLVPKTNISKYELLRVFKEVFKKEDVDIQAKAGPMANKTLINTRSDFDFTVSSYSIMISEMRTWVLDHKNLYDY